MADLNLKDDPFPKEWDGEKVRDWFARRLEGRAMPEIQLLAGRAALRRLPFLGALLDIPSLGQQSSAKALLFACLRCYPISVASAFVPPTEIEGLRSAAAAANSTAFSAADSVARSAAAAAKSTA